MNGLDTQFFGDLIVLNDLKLFYDNYINSNIRNIYEWTTQTGQKIKISLIKDNHLDNIIKMLERKESKHKILDILKIEKRYRKEYNFIIKSLNDHYKIMDLVF